MKSAADRRVGRLVTPPFAVAVVVLGAAAVVSGPVASRLGLRQPKAPLPLRRPLDALDADRLGPYRLVPTRGRDGRVIDDGRRVLDGLVVEQLGTDAYLSWSLEDTSVPRGNPLRYATLFVTYYTGPHHLVPHTPDACYLGQGYQPAQPHETMAVDVTMHGGSSSIRLPIRVCTFEKSGVFNWERPSVVYTFHCNGRFVATREGVRLRVTGLGNRYAYFSKVEVSFPRATRAQTIDGARKLLGFVLPVLVERHWPDFDAAERAAREAGS
ncbi:MAG: hypothetical protein ACE5E6_11870 [Phycisphaerae bacterium]